MKRLLRFNKVYFCLTVLLLSIEVFIALYVHDAIIRPYIGDLLVVILMYTFIKSFLNTPVLPTVIGVLLFSYLVEFLQYCRLINILGLQDSKIASTLIGVSFEWIDMLAYTAGAALILAGESLIGRKENTRSIN
jgi:hypothetical protein